MNGWYDIFINFMKIIWCREEESFKLRYDESSKEINRLTDYLMNNIIYDDDKGIQRKEQ